MRQASRYFPPGPARVIDVGAHDGELFQLLGEKLAEGFGIEPLAKQRFTLRNAIVVPGFFPEQRPPTQDWDIVTMLAVLEHIPRTQQPTVAEACHEVLRVGGRVIVTVPSRSVDAILCVLRWARLIDGMSLEEHYGFSPSDTKELFRPPRFRLLVHRRFQLGLNHLFIFEKQ